MSRREFRGDLVFYQRHADAVAEEPFRKAKNCNIYTQDFQDVVVECVRSFLEARAAKALLATPLQEVSSRPRFQVLLQAELMVLGVVEDVDAADVDDADDADDVDVDGDDAADGDDADAAHVDAADGSADAADGDGDDAEDGDAAVARFAGRNTCFTQ